jgi:hypothetical protein
MTIGKAGLTLKDGTVSFCLLAPMQLLDHVWIAVTDLARDRLAMILPRPSLSTRPSGRTG